MFKKRIWLEDLKMYDAICGGKLTTLQIILNPAVILGGSIMMWMYFSSARTGKTGG